MKRELEARRRERWKQLLIYQTLKYIINGDLDLYLQRQYIFFNFLFFFKKDDTKCFHVVDVLGGCWQVPLKQRISTFSTPLGRNMFFKLLFMLVFTSELFQQKMQQVLDDLKRYFNLCKHSGRTWSEALNSSGKNHIGWAKPRQTKMYIRCSKNKVPRRKNIIPQSTSR